MAVVTAAMIPGSGSLARVRTKAVSAMSALREVDGETAGRGFLVLHAHVAAGLAHGLDAGVERHDVGAVAAQRERGGGDGLDGAEAVALDAGDLDEAA